MLSREFDDWCILPENIKTRGLLGRAFPHGRKWDNIPILAVLVASAWPGPTTSECYPTGSDFESLCF